MSQMESPFKQFEINKLFSINIADIDLSYTNSSLFMTIAVLLISITFILAMKNATLVPNRIQSFAEIIYEFIETTLIENTGKEGLKYFNLIFSIFLFVLTLNLLGMVPYGFTVTSHIIVTFSMAMMIFLSVTSLGFIRHGFKFLKLFLPSGTPWWLAPLMILIEIFSYFSRPISLSVRLAANMIAGHILLKVIAGFVVMLGIIWGALPIPLLVLLTGFEIFVAILQAYIFTILTCVYLNDAINLH